MDMSLDLWSIWPAVVVTLLAVVVAAVVFRKPEDPTSSKSAQKSRAVSESKQGETGRPRPLEALSRSRGPGDDPGCPQELLSGKGTESESTAHTDQDLEEDPCQRDESTNCPSVKKVDQEDKPLRYMPGMLRTSQLEKMMSREELEEERRVQREQLTAIFKLLKENQDAFGEVTENDMEEQLKLYSI
ncbi:uncharacterized protein mxra7 [Salminus brasiliensis]|uniref:uncharacterized protein mxra7 n=1 Tax=Salminus brasiliensis TaxID=930266 RepID=UPI003B830EC0